MLSGMGRLASVVSVSAAAGWLACQPALGDNSIRLEIRLSDAVLTPGEVQHIEVWAYTDPKFGHSFFHPIYGWETSNGFGATFFDLDNRANGETGEFVDILASSNELAIFDPGVSQSGGVSGVIAVGHPCVFGPNPNDLLVWSATWVPDDYATREVAFSTLTTKSKIATLHDFCYLPWPSEDSCASFKVVPAPGGAAAFLSLGAAGLPRRRR